MAVLIFLPLIVVLAGLLLVAHRLVVYLWDPNKLRKYPALNPLCGITNLGYIFELWRCDKFRTRALCEAHRDIEVLRIGPNALSFSNVRAIKDIYGHSTTCSKGDMYSTPAGPHRSLLDCVDKVEHSVKRKRVAAAFAIKHLQAWEHKVVDKCSRLITQFDRQCVLQAGKKDFVDEDLLDFRWWSNLFTIEAIADIAMSEYLGLLESADDSVIALTEQGTTHRVPFIESLHGIGRAEAPVVWSQTTYPVLRRFFSSISSSYADQIKNESNFNNIVRQMTTSRYRRFKSGEKLDDFFTCLLEDKQGQMLDSNLGEVAAEVGVFMNAGSDTTAIALTHALYYLLKNPDQLQRLREELDALLDDGDVIPAYAVVKNATYLKACLDESLRLSPPVSFGLERKTPPEGTSIDNEWIAGNVMVSVPAYLAHRDPSVFPDPENYMPQRWLTEEAKAVQKYFIPFSAGARGCVGRNISYLEQHVLLASLLRRYEFALPHPEWELDWEEQFNLWPCSMPLRIWRRQT